MQPNCQPWNPPSTLWTPAVIRPRFTLESKELSVTKYAPKNLSIEAIQSVIRKWNDHCAGQTCLSLTRFPNCCHGNEPWDSVISGSMAHVSLPPDSTACCIQSGELQEQYRQESVTVCLFSLSGMACVVTLKHLWSQKSNYLWTQLFVAEISQVSGPRAPRAAVTPACSWTHCSCGCSAKDPGITSGSQFPACTISHQQSSLAGMGTPNCTALQDEIAM